MICGRPVAMHRGKPGGERFPTGQVAHKNQNNVFHCHLLGCTYLLHNFCFTLLSIMHQLSLTLTLSHTLSLPACIAPRFS